MSFSLTFVNILYIKFTKISNFGAQSQTRTGTPKQKFLRLPSLPIPSFGHKWSAGWVSSPLPLKGMDLQSIAFADSLPTEICPQ